jgi:hypothetical protein
MDTLHFLSFLVMNIYTFTCFNQTFHLEHGEKYRILFWNSENFFDTVDDPLTNDDEFTPNGSRRWSYQRYGEKVKQVYKVLTAAGNPFPPEIIALCELENSKVLTDLTANSPFFRFGYKFIHMDSPDSRGIDVAVLYDPFKVEILHEQFHNPFLDKPSLKSRYILYVKAVIHKTDTIHLFVNHWPSKYGGKGITEEFRILAAKALKSYSDSIFSTFYKPKIIITGDFNDSPYDISVSGFLGAECLNSKNIEHNKLYNLSCEAMPGTYKFQGIWEVLDQFIVSGTLLGEAAKTKKPGFEIFQEDFLLINDESYSGVKPYRTWEGMKYAGGYSDHLPIILSVF